MSHQPVAYIPIKKPENEGGSHAAQAYAESLGVTRFLGETYVVGGYPYTNLADAVAQGRRIQAQGARS